MDQAQRIHPFHSTEDGMNNGLSPIRTGPFLILTAAILLGLGARPATAELIASITQINGIAMISNGAHYTPASEGAILKAGDRLIVLEGGQATLLYSDHCLFQQTDQHILDVKAQSTCELGQGGEYRPDLATIESPQLQTAVAEQVQQEGLLEFPTAELENPLGLDNALTIQPIPTAAASTSPVLTGSEGLMTTAPSAPSAAAGIGGASSTAGGIFATTGIAGLSLPSLTAMAVIGGVAITEAAQSKTTDEPQPEPLSE
jgi:hypothetical protein